MEEVTIEVETITPLFIAGADQRSIENEGLRAPSLRGLLRWWFRSIMGGMVSVSDLKNLENKIFGFTNQKSSIRILSTTEAQPLEIDIQEPSLKYLWFSIDLQKKKRQRLQYYPPKTKFEIRIISRDENCLKIVLGCLWTLIYLGGAGARMRRGAGSLKVNYCSDNAPYEFVFNGKTIRDIKEFIEKNLTKIFDNFKKYADRKYNPQTKPDFSVLSRKHAKISLINEYFNKWLDGFKRVVNIYKNHRADKNVIERFVWGLPILSPQKLNKYENLLRKKLSKRLSREDINKEVKKLKRLGIEELLKEIKKSKDRIRQMFLKLLLIKKLRQASPLLIGVIDLNGRYAIRLVKFYTSIHTEFSSKLSFLQKDLNEFDNKINSELNEITIELPEV